MKVDLLNEPLGTDKKGEPVYLRDVWPSSKEIQNAVRKFVTAAMFKKRYADVFAGDRAWRKIKTVTGLTYQWDAASTYVQHPPYFAGLPRGRARSAMSAARGCSACSATASPPITSRPPARSRRRARPAAISSATASAPSISIRTARGAAITR
jgi:aconitate hydratase